MMILMGGAAIQACGTLKARVAKSADAKDLKSFFAQAKCGFKSRPGHQLASLGTNVLRRCLCMLLSFLRLQIPLGALTCVFNVAGIGDVVPPQHARGLVA